MIRSRQARITIARNHRAAPCPRPQEGTASGTGEPSGGDGTWTEQGVHEGHVGHAYLQDSEALLAEPQPFDPSGGVAYRFDTEGGTYDVWVRRLVPADWGDGLGDERSDSA